MKSYLFVGESNSENLGDSVICNLTLQFARKELQDRADYSLFDISCARCTLVGKLLSKLKQICNIDLFSSYQFVYTYLRAYFIVSKSTTIIFVGGEIFLDYFINAIFALLSLSKRKGLNVRFHSCGVGKMSEKSNLRFLQYLKSVKLECFTLRDGIKYYQSVIPNVRQIPDIAICANEFYLSSPKSKKIGWGVINVESYNFNYPNNPISLEEYLLMSEFAIREILALGYDVEIFTNGSPIYYIVAKSLHFRFNQLLTLAVRPKNDRDLVYQISKYNIVIASRLHALILSYSYKIPFVGIVWDAKVEEFANLIGYSNRVYKMSCLTNINWSNTLEEIRENGILKNELLISQVHEQIKTL